MIKQDIQDIINYLSEFEEQHFEECEKEEQENHIYNKVKLVQDWLYSPACPLTEEGEK